MPTKVLGLSFDYHDAAAAVVIDGQTVAAVQEERITRRKHDAVLPEKAIRACLSIAGISPEELDAVVHYEEPLHKFERIVRTAATQPRRALGFLGETLQMWFKQGKFDVVERISESCGIGDERIMLVDHHQAHAAAAFYCSNFDRATVVTIDGVGEFETASVWRGDGTRLERIHSINFPRSLGLVYSAFTAFLGFEVNEGEYKVMGMAAFGKPVHADAVRRIVHFHDGQLELDRRYFDFVAPERYFFTEEFERLFGAPREPESQFDIAAPGENVEPRSLQAVSQEYADIAASIQLVTEEIMMDLVRWAVGRTGIENVCMAGGVALNSLANGRIQRELGYPLYVQPAAGDCGSALGAAMLGYVQLSGGRPQPLSTAFLGESYTQSQILDALKAAGVTSYDVYDDDATMFAHVARLLRDGSVVGWFQGRYEWGPRALGARSIIANPMIGDMKRIINEKIKFREPFRPFAPAVLAERATEFFEVAAPANLLEPENFMLSVAPVKPEARAVIPAVTHADGTARLQTVHREHATPFRRLIETFGELTGVPVLLNTSFNRRGEPIVASPSDALQTFLWSGLDHLVMDRVVVRKELSF